uniref:hydroxyacid oxidase 1-like n=1 Tax=Styela clava TaxID=7725 RepID=UPI00193AD636|nr:hydroxyacid oxidase 1-like [Styela clava]
MGYRGKDLLFAYYKSVLQTRYMNMRASVAGDNFNSKSTENLLVSVKDYEEEARRKLSQYDWGYYAAGAIGGETIKENCEAFKREITDSGSAESHGVGMTVSVLSSKTMEEIATEVPNCIKWCQVQLTKNRVVTKHYVRRAEQNGFKGFIATVDHTVNRHRDYRYEDGKPFDFETSIIVEPNKLAFDALESWMDGSVEWDSIDWLKGLTKLPVVVKGIMTAEMALIAVEHKVDGIIVSNHGGRILDSTFATIDVLPEVVKAVNGKVDVYFDGGIRNGTDVAKAIALGAKAVFVGRPILWGLACEGEEGVRNVLEILKNEFIYTMKFLGVSTIKELQTTPDVVVHETRYFSKL